MALIVEDGTGLSNANAYVSESEVNSYFSARSNDINASWDGQTTAKKEAAILYATAYLDNNFCFVGEIANSTQSLSWPRSWVYDSEGRDIESNIVPQRIKNACAELALEALEKSLSPALPRGGEVKKQKVGSIEVEYFDDAKPEKTFPLVTQIIQGLITNNDNTVTLVR